MGKEVNVDIALVKKLYVDEKLSLRSVAKQLSVSECVIRTRLNRMGISIDRSRKFTHTIKAVDHSAFSGDINEEKAYWIGFILGDGCIRNAKLSPTISIELSSIDHSHIEKFKTFMKSDHKIYVADRSGIYNFAGGRGDEYVERKTSSITFASKQVAKDLGRYGVNPNKTGSELACDELKFNRHFWRGVIDADGSVRHEDWMSKAGNVCRRYVFLCGTEELCNQFLDWVRTFVDTETKVYPYKSGNLHRVRITGPKASVILNRLYDDCEISLDRKSPKVEAI